MRQDLIRLAIVIAGSYMYLRVFSNYSFWTMVVSAVVFYLSGTGVDKWLSNSRKLPDNPYIDPYTYLSLSLFWLFFYSAYMVVRSFIAITAS